MQQTQKWMKATIVELPDQLGRLTISEAAQVMDALSGVYVVCCHVLHDRAQGNPSWERRLEALRQTSDVTLAQARKRLALWKRHTNWQLPDASAVERFLWSLENH